MKSLVRPQWLAAAALGLAAFAGASAAHARSDVYFSIGVAPAYVAPAPVYVAPRPVYVPPPVVYSQPAEVYVRPAAPVYYYGYDNEREWRRAQWRRHYWRHHHRDWERSRGDWD